MNEEPFADRIREHEHDAERLENLYRKAVAEGRGDSFCKSMLAVAESKPENVLLTAWYYRLTDRGTTATAHTTHRVRWWLAAPIGLVTGLVLWSISAPDLTLLDRLPYLALLWSPVLAVAVMAFAVWIRRTGWRRGVASAAALAVAAVYVILVAPTLDGTVRDHYVDLAALHLPLLAFVAVGITLIGLREDPLNRFGYLSKSLEVFITTGLFGIAAGIFGAISAGLFQSLGASFPEWFVRLALCAGAGLVPLTAVAVAYDPAKDASRQGSSQGLSRLIATLMRVLLPLTSAVLVVYLVYIPFSFMEAFEDRDVLIVYNVMLFAVMALLVGAIPLTTDDLSDRVWALLRQAIVILACLAVVVSLYALAAIVYRTAGGGFTVNRVTVIGWNSINILILILLIVRQMSANRKSWLTALHSVFSVAAYGYVAWGLFVVLILPLLFG